LHKTSTYSIKSDSHSESPRTFIVAISTLYMQTTQCHDELEISLSSGERFNELHYYSLVLLLLLHFFTVFQKHQVSKIYSHKDNSTISIQIIIFFL